MGEEKFHMILMRHKEETHRMVSEPLDNGWRTWSAQAAELQLLRADHENRKKQGSRFFKMDESSINMVREELMNDISQLTAQHMEEINRMLDKFKDQQIMTAMQLDAYEVERHQEDNELDEEEPSRKQSDTKVPMQESQHEEAAFAPQCSSEHQGQAASVNPEE